METHQYRNTWYENDDQLQELYHQNPDITEITVIGLDLTELSCLIQFRQLQTLYVGGMCHSGTHPDYHNTIQDFSALCRLPHLRYLQIHDCLRFDELQLRFVSKIPNLQGLSITSYMKTIENFHALSNIHQLQALEVENMEDLTPLRYLQKLRFLHLRNRYDDWCIDDFTPLSFLPELQECVLELAAPKRLDLRPLAQLSTLKLLDLSPCQAGIGVPHLDFLQTRLPTCHIIPVSQPPHSQTNRIFRAGIEGIFRELIAKL